MGSRYLQRAALNVFKNVVEEEDEKLIEILVTGILKH